MDLARADAEIALRTDPFNGQAQGVLGALGVGKTAGSTK
jgi:hypothetical protein